MQLLTLLLVLVVIGFAWWFVAVRCMWIAAPIKGLIYFVLFAVAVCFVLQAFGLWDRIRGVQVPRI